jgi:hypothetical protein
MRTRNDVIDRRRALRKLETQRDDALEFLSGKKAALKEVRLKIKLAKRSKKK